MLYPFHAEAITVHIIPVPTVQWVIVEAAGYTSRCCLSIPDPTAAAAAKSLQSCLTLCDPIDGSPPGSSIHGIFQARVLEWGAIAFSTSW